MTRTQYLKDTAIGYARRGLPVFPLYHATERGQCTCNNPECDRIAKHPRTNHGFKDATTVPERVSEFWERNPLANIGIATGVEAGVIVIDIDPRHGGDASLRRYEAE